ncbi:MAG: hypothetical protein LBG76_00590, partial [Treponema sp.]|nr:hypothetical protein [Treponema sp.]
PPPLRECFLFHGRFHPFAHPFPPDKAHAGGNAPSVYSTICHISDWAFQEGKGKTGKIMKSGGE